MSKKDGFGHEKPHEGETNDWITPKWVIDAFDKYSGDKGMFFDLDPCISQTQPRLTARDGYNQSQDGLAQNWYGTVWCNPPYGSNVGKWANKISNHGNGIMLIFARTETEVWFDNIFSTASAYLFLKGRIVFHLPDGSLPRNSKGRVASAGAPSVFVAWGEESASVLFEMCKRGMVDEFGALRKCAFFDGALMY